MHLGVLHCLFPSPCFPPKWALLMRKSQLFSPSLQPLSTRPIAAVVFGTYIFLIAASQFLGPGWSIPWVEPHITLSSNDFVLSTIETVSLSPKWAPLTRSFPAVFRSIAASLSITDCCSSHYKYISKRCFATLCGFLFGPSLVLCFRRTVLSSQGEERFGCYQIRRSASNYARWPTVIPSRGWKGGKAGWECRGKVW